MGKFSLAIAFLFAVLPCRSQAPLREQLQSAGIPEASFTEAQLNAPVDGATAENNQFVYLVYVVRTTDGDLTGQPQVVRYNSSTGAVIHGEVKPGDDPYCCGSPEGIDFLDDYLRVSFHFNPSAGSIAILDNNLKLVDLLDGFGIDRVAPNEGLYTENMVHFAPTHQERLQWVNLASQQFLEVYPLRNDALRNRFEKEFGKKAPEACEKSEDICNYGMFDEGCAFLGGNNKDQFALHCGRSASYHAKEGEEPIIYASDDAIYLYAHHAKGWLYCEQAITDDESQKLDSVHERAYESIKNRCVPNLPVLPDSSKD
jgi:hypothetical protein